MVTISMFPFLFSSVFTKYEEEWKIVHFMVIKVKGKIILVNTRFLSHLFLVGLYVCNIYSGTFYKV